MAHLTDQSKAISIIWEITANDGSDVTRFVYNDHSSLDHSGADFVFTGAEPRNEIAAEFDPKTGRLNVARFDFSVVDKDQAVSAWLRDHDAVIAKAKVRRLLGLQDRGEDLYTETFWSLEDYKVSTKGGGGYQFSCDNVLKQMSVSLYDGHAGQGKLNADINSIVTTITLEDVPSAAWPTSGTNFALLYDTGTRDMELITYTGISGSDLTGVTRAKYGVGGSAPNGTAFQADSCEIYHVWVKRDNPVSLALKLLMSTDAAGVSVPAEKSSNPDLDDWTGGIPDDHTRSIAGGSITEETGADAFNGSSAKFSKTAQLALWLKVTKTNYNLGKWFRLSFVAKTDIPEDDQLEVSINNDTKTKQWDVPTQAWVTPPATDTYFRLTTDYVRYSVEFQIDATFDLTDSIEVTIQHVGANGSTIWFDNANTGYIYGPFDSKPNGGWDVGDGNGIGDAILPEFINSAEIETVKMANMNDPTWDGSDEELLTGTAVLFVEKEPIADVKRFVEDFLLRPFGFKPLVDVKERLTISTYFDIAQTEVEIGDKWMKKDFSASRWKRNWSNKINNIRLLADWDPIKGEHSFADSAVQQASIDRYGKAKKLEMPCRGCRTGLNGFPDYGSEADILGGIGLIFLEIANPFSQIEIDAFYEFKNVSSRDTVRVSIPTIPDLAQGVRGVTNKPFFVDKKIVDNQVGKVKFTIRERRPVARPAFIATNVATDNYTGASSAEREAGTYLTPGSAGKFDNDDEGYTIIGSN